MIMKYHYKLEQHVGIVWRYPAVVGSKFPVKTVQFDSPTIISSAVLWITIVKRGGVVEILWVVEAAALEKV